MISDLIDFFIVINKSEKNLKKIFVDIFSGSISHTYFDISNAL